MTPWPGAVLLCHPRRWRRRGRLRSECGPTRRAWPGPSGHRGRSFGPPRFVVTGPHLFSDKRIASRTRCVGVGVAPALGFFAVPVFGRFCCRAGCGRSVRAAVRSPAAARTPPAASTASGAASSSSRLLERAPMPRPRARRAHSHTRPRLHDGCRGLRLQARARCGCQKFAGHQSELGLGAAPAPRRGVPGPLVVRRACSLGP